MPKRKVEFFMMLTNRSILLAKYTITSYNKVFKLLHNKYELKLTCFLNAINEEKYQANLDKLLQITPPHFLNYVKSRYTYKDFKWNGSGYEVKGTTKVYPLPMITPAEGQDEYFQLTTADYFVTVDDDFEVLKPDFIKKMLEYMDNCDTPCISTDKSPRHYGFDVYSNGYVEGQARNCTWFCIYRVSKRLPISMCVVDTFYRNNGDVITWKGSDSEITWDKYEEVFRNEKGIRKVWDNGGWLQERMRDGMTIVSINDYDDYTKQYIHYAAFASNSSINTPFKTALYRFLMINEKRSSMICTKKILRKTRKVLFPCKERVTTNQVSSLD